MYRLTITIGLALVLSGCVPVDRSSASAAYIDEAFARLFPETAAYLSKRPGLVTTKAGAQDRIDDSSGVKQEGYFALARLSEYSGKLIREWRTGPSAPAILIASPLAAASLIQALPVPGPLASPGSEKTEASPSDESMGVTIHSDLPRLVVPFGGSLAAQRENLWSVGYDFPSAYAELGEKAGKIVAKKNSSLAKGNKVICLVIFQDNILRGKEAVDAFGRSYGSIAGEESLKIELIPDAGSSVDSHGAIEQIYRKYLDPQILVRPAVVLLGIDDAFAAEEAALNGFGSAGDGKPPEPEFMADCGSWGEDRANRRLFAWRIEADGREIGKKAYALARKLEAGAEDAAAAEDDQSSVFEESRVSLVSLRLFARGRIF
jgi:hypothetical protein